jgi:hypothetical protein
VKAALEQFDATATNKRHLAKSKQLADKDMPLRADVGNWISTFEVSPALSVEILVFAMWRTNELSAESIHRQCQLLSDRVANHDGVFLSFGLRSEDGFHMFPDMKSWASVAAGLRGDVQIMESFGFMKHESIAAFQDDQLLQGRNVQSGRRGFGALSRAVFYKTDVHSMFKLYPCFQKVIDQRKKELKAEDERRNKEPVRKAGPSGDTCKIKYAMAFLEDNAKEDQLLSLPIEHADTLVSLNSVLASKPNPSESDVDMSDMLDYSKMTGMGTNSCPMIIFRVVCTNPRSRKSHAAASDVLRSDHVVVIKSQVEAEDKDRRTFNVISSMFDDESSSGAQVHLLSMDTLLACGMATLKQKMITMELTPDSVYTFYGQPLSAAARASQGWEFANQFVAAHAFPGTDRSWSVPDSLGSETLAVLNELVAFELVVELRSRNFQLSPRGFSCLRRSRRTSDFHHFFKRRKGVALTDLSQWELMDQLDEWGWEGHVFPKRVKLCAFALTAGVALIGKYYWNSSCEINHDYLKVLASTKELSLLGLKEIKQKEHGSYYSGIVDFLRPEKKLAIENQGLHEFHDDDATLASSILDLSLADHAESFLAIEDALAEEGDASSQEEDFRDDVGSLDELGSPAPPSATNGAVPASPDGFEKWGSFTFRVQSTIKAPRGCLEEKWVVRCPHHRDAGDRASTSCTKSAVFHSLEQKHATKQWLRQWCLEGRNHQSRAEEGGHRWLERRHITNILPSHEQDLCLIDAEKDASWILPARPKKRSRSSNSGTS